MEIAIQAADLDHGRIDGTRVYLWQILKRLGVLAPAQDFYLYHKNTFNSAFALPKYKNYTIRHPQPFPMWTQTAFSHALYFDRPDVLWMPMQAMPFFTPKNMRKVVTVHDLAFLKYPGTFPKEDEFKLRALTKLVVRKSNSIIAVSEHTKKDILHFYPGTPAEKIRVIYHGCDECFFARASESTSTNLPTQERAIFKKNDLKQKKYLLYVGAIQPRKDLLTLIRAFEQLKKYDKYSELQLVLAGERAWLWESTIDAIKKSSSKKDIIELGRVSFDNLVELYRQARVFVFPSKYEGFGIPILEAFASGVPVVAARNSCLTEIGGGAAEYFETGNSEALSLALRDVLESPFRQGELIKKGKERVKYFTWERAARETLKVLLGEYDEKVEV